MRNLLLYTFLGLAVAAGAYVSFELFGPKAPLPKYAQAGIGGDFKLTSVEGEINLSDYKGEIVLIYFGFMSCPDVCPTSMGVMGTAIRQLDDAQQQKDRGLFISVDPQRDTPAELHAYTQYFSDRIFGATGTKEQIDAIVKQYGAYYSFVEMEDSALGYTVDHSARIYLIDPDGELADILAHDINPVELHEKLAAYL